VPRCALLFPSGAFRIRKAPRGLTGPGRPDIMPPISFLRGVLAVAVRVKGQITLSGQAIIIIANAAPPRGNGA
jgi:hypothetical protein